MNPRRNALAIIGAQALVTASNIQNRRIELLVEGFWKGFTEPFQVWRRRSILEGNHDHGVSEYGLAEYGLAADTAAGSGNVLGAKRRAEKQRNHKDENSGACHHKSIISA